MSLDKKTWMNYIFKAVSLWFCVLQPGTTKALSKMFVMILLLRKEDSEDLEKNK